MSIVPIEEGELDMWDPMAWALSLGDFHFPPSISNFNFLHDIGMGSVNTHLEWRETPRAHVWKVVLPGFADQHVLLELQDERVLQVSVESGDFASRFKIPQDANLHDLKATMHQGVLVVTVPKFEPARNVRVIQIN